MRRFFVVLAFVGSVLFIGAGTTSYDGTAIHKKGAQTMQGPLTMDAEKSIHWTSGAEIGANANGTLILTPNANGNISLGLNPGSGQLILPDETQICMDGSLCTHSLANTSLGVSVSSTLLAGVSITTPTVSSLVAGQLNFVSDVPATGGTDIAFVSDTNNALTAADKLWSWRLQGAEKAYVLGDGTLYGKELVATAGSAYTSTGIFRSRDNATVPMLYGTSADGASAVGTAVNNSTALTTAGAKLFSVRNAGTEKANIDLYGMLQIGVGNSFTPVTCDATTRGKFWYYGAPAGSKDSVLVCAKDAANAYAWRTIY